MELSSEEDTAQGCPLAMAMYVYMYAVCTMPLIDACHGTQSSVDCDVAIQPWCADDAAAGVRLRALRLFWDLFIQHGFSYKDFPKPPKTFLVVKPQLRDEAALIFTGIGV